MKFMSDKHAIASMRDALIDAYELIEYAKAKGAYVSRGGDHYKQTGNVAYTLAAALDLNPMITTIPEMQDRIAKLRGEK